MVPWCCCSSIDEHELAFVSKGLSKQLHTLAAEMSRKKFTALQQHLRTHTLDDTQAMHSLWVPDGDVWNTSDTAGTILLQFLGMLLLYFLVSQIKNVFATEDITG